MLLGNILTKRILLHNIEDYSCNYLPVVPDSSSFLFIKVSKADTRAWHRFEFDWQRVQSRVSLWHCTNRMMKRQTDAKSIFILWLFRAWHVRKIERNQVLNSSENPRLSRHKKRFWSLYLTVITRAFNFFLFQLVQ